MSVLSVIKFKIDFIRSVLLPSVSMLLSAEAVGRLFLFPGRGASAWLIGVKCVFTLCSFLFFQMLFGFVFDRISAYRNHKNASKTSISENPSRRA